MDIIPISTKVLGSLGEGITHTLTGVYVMLTGVDEDGRQMHEFGSSEGILSEQMIFGRYGTPSTTDYIIHIDVTVKGGLPYERKLPMAAFKACDEFIQNIRLVLKELDGRDATQVREYFDKIRPNAKKVVIVKQIAGQGAMYDNQLFSQEPSGLSGGISIIDMANVPMIISPNEYRDGALRAMT
jgi:D-proline reductase (dithiol) PrdD